jgi:hypothetical protein
MAGLMSWNVAGRDVNTVTVAGSTGVVSVETMAAVAAFTAAAREPGFSVVRTRLRYSDTCETAAVFFSTLSEEDEPQSDDEVRPCSWEGCTEVSTMCAQRCDLHRPPLVVADLFEALGQFEHELLRATPLERELLDDAFRTIRTMPPTPMATPSEAWSAMYTVYFEKQGRKTKRARQE